MSAHPPPAVHAPHPGHYARHQHHWRHRHHRHAQGFLAPPFVRVTVVVTIKRSDTTVPNSPLSYNYAQKAPLVPQVTVTADGDVIMPDLKAAVIFRYELNDQTGGDFEFRRPRSEAFYTGEIDKAHVQPWTDDSQFRFSAILKTGMVLRFGYSNCAKIGSNKMDFGYYMLRLEDRTTHETSESDPKIKNGGGGFIIDDPDITRPHPLQPRAC